MTTACHTTSTVTWLLRVAPLLAALLGACHETPPPDWSMDMPTAVGDRNDIATDTGNDAGNGVGDGSGGGSPASPAAGAPDGLPCEVSDLLDAECRSCHSPQLGIQPMLMSLQQLLAPSSTDPSRSVAELSLATMQDAANAMPPAGLLVPADVTPFADWVTAGTPAGNCGATGAGGGGGAGAVGPSPFGGPAVCSTNTFWDMGDQGSHKMYPGRACNDCHVDLDQGPVYLVAGTVFETGHEPDDCYGTLADVAGAYVEITDAGGGVHQLPIKTAGNFSIKGDPAQMPFPVTAKVVSPTGSIAMIAPIQAADGDCNTCHSPTGSDGAPGRVILP